MTFQKVPGTSLDDCQDESASIQEALQNMLNAVKQNNGESIISEYLIECLLGEPADDENPSSVMQFQCAQGDEHQISDEENTPLYEQTRGVPLRPFYRELSHRLFTIHQHKNKISTPITESNVCGAKTINDKKRRRDEPQMDITMLPFLPASHFGVTEFQCMSSLVPEPPQQLESVKECTKWLQNAGENGILATLGMRRTIGTVSKCFDDSSDDSNLEVSASSAKQYLLPPSISQLLASSRKLHKPNTKSSLTVAARALAKHAHRGADGFFGISKGGESQKNMHAEMVVQRLIREAAWINIHAFGGVDDARPVMEVRTIEGYGARWSAVWEKNAFSPEDVFFRGFLEPNTEDGHENGWRH